MSVTIHIPTLLRSLVGGRREVTAAGRSVNELFFQLDALHPGFLSRVVEAGEVRTRLYVFVNGREIRSAQGLRTRVDEGDEVYIVPSIGGAAGCV